MSKRKLLLAALAATPADLERLVKRLDETAVRHAPSAGQWSIADVVCHFHLVEEQYRARLQRVAAASAAEERPALPAIHPDQTQHGVERPLAVLLADFRAARLVTHDWLSGLGAGVWQRTAVHASWGPVTLRTLVQRLVDHDTDHLAQIVELKQEIG